MVKLLVLPDLHLARHLHQETLPVAAWVKYLNVGWVAAHSLLCL